MNLVVDLNNHWRYWAIAAVVVVFLFMHRDQIAGVLKPLFFKAKALLDKNGPRPGWGWMLVIVMLVLVWPGKGESPLPIGPTPVPEVKQDAWGKQTEVLRSLIAEALEQHSQKDFAGDDEATKDLQARIQAASEGAMGPLWDKMLAAAKAGPERANEFARKLKAGELE